MGRYIGSKSRLCKRVGVNIFDNPKFTNILAKKSKKKFTKKLSEYAVQLKEKQLARYMYSISEKQFKAYFKKANNKEGVTGTELLKLLERRLDNVLYRSGLAETRNQARQMVSHGHFQYNGNKVTVPSVLVKEGDKIVLRKKMQTSPLYVGFGSVKPAKWIQVNSKDKTLTIDRMPEDDELEQIINVQKIVEFYSR
jgi:small subunit ribosomal protein S4